MALKKSVFFILLLGLFVIWWIAVAPPAYHSVPGRIVFASTAVDAAEAVDQSEAFAQNLELIPSTIPGHDDLLFLHDGQTILASAMDGKIWKYNRATNKAEPFFDAPLMASGLHESLTDEDEIYFCASYLWGDKYPEAERVGLYRLKISSRKLEPVVLNVPDTKIVGAKVWALDDPTAPRLNKDGSGSPSRPLAFCNDLEITADGSRIYLTEPFAYEGASMGGGTIPEVIAYHGNGRVWHHDLESGETRLVAEGFFFPDGILYDLHPGQTQEESILSSQTGGFRIIRFYVSGAKSGTSELVHDGLAGMCDGMDRDPEGNVWCGMYAQRTGSITWLHENPFIKYLLLRLPLNWISQPKVTGTLALSPDGSEMLYSAWYEGPKATHIASAIPGPDGYIYMTPFSREHRGLVRLPNPLLQLKAGGSD